MISLAQLQRLFPTTPAATLNAFVPALAEYLPKVGINTPLREAAFLSQTGVESGGFTATKENLNYSADRLLAVFSKYFPTEAIARQYAHNAQAIGSRAYANRLGNGNEQTGDGFKYRGRGLIQVTGKSNYQAFAEWLQLSLDDAAALAETPAGAVASACWFWFHNSLNAYADRADIVGLSKRVNGGTNGLADRQELFTKARKLLNC